MDLSEAVINLQDKVYADNQGFKKKCDLLSMRLIYKYQQQEHINLMSALESIPVQFHKLPFHS